MTGTASSTAVPGTALPAPRRPTHASLAAVADLVEAAIRDAREVLAEVGAAGRGEH